MSEKSKKRPGRFDVSDRLEDLKKHYPSWAKEILLDEKSRREVGVVEIEGRKWLIPGSENELKILKERVEDELKRQTLKDRAKKRTE